jgi:hypothetical protein
MQEDDDGTFDIAPRNSNPEKKKPPKQLGKQSPKGVKKSPLRKKGSGQHLEIEYERPEKEKEKLRR